MSGTVVDTSVWIDFLAGHPAAALEEALVAGTVILPPIVLSELVSGARSEADRANLERVLSDLPLAVTSRAHWLRVGELRGFLARQGVSVSTPDAHVAQCALDLDALLVTRDRIFSTVARHAPLRLRGTSDEQE